MKKFDLRNGDLVVNRAGYIGVVDRGPSNKIWFKNHGSISLKEYEMDMTHKENSVCDIMEVYRDCKERMVLKHKVMPIYCRDGEWKYSSKEEQELLGKSWVEYMQQRIIKEQERQEYRKNNRIDIVAQGFYGNRTGTAIVRDEVKYFIRGYISEDLYDDEAIANVNLQYVPTPGNKDIVIVYDQYQEDEYVNVEFPKRYERDNEKYRELWGEDMEMYVTCMIPELNLTLHTRCFACRIDENGVLQSLQDGDSKRV